MEAIPQQLTGDNAAFPPDTHCKGGAGQVADRIFRPESLALCLADLQRQLALRQAMP